MAEEFKPEKLLEDIAQKFDELLQEREHILKRGEEVDRQIAGLHKSANGLALYIRAQEEVSISLKKTLENTIKRFAVISDSTPTKLVDAVRNALQLGPHPMSALQVRDHLATGNFDFSMYRSNPLSSIHTTLKRLRDNAEVEEVVVDGARHFKWAAKTTAQTVAPQAEWLADILGPRIRINQPGIDRGNAGVVSLSPSTPDFSKFLVFAPKKEK